jgi:catechol 2,3-dioxygenase-like lactoylglutathione lyase family enzyme
MNADQAAHIDVLRGIDHVSFTVRDVARSTAFYQQLGFEPYDRWQESPEQCAEGLGIADAHVDLAQLRGHGILLELMAFQAPATDGAGAPAPVRVGAAHLAFSVSDIEAAARLVEDAGGERISPVQHDPVADWVQLADPDGIRIELMRLHEPRKG